MKNKIVPISALDTTPVPEEKPKFGWVCYFPHDIYEDIWGERAPIDFFECVRGEEVAKCKRLLAKSKDHLFGKFHIVCEETGMTHSFFRKKRLSLR